MRTMQGNGLSRVALAGNAVVAVLLLIGCTTDSPVAPNAVPGAHATVGVAAAQQYAGAIVEPAARQRFGPITVDAVSPIRVGIPVRLEVTADVNIPTTRARAELEVPEVAEIVYRSTHGLHARARLNPGVQLLWRGAAHKGPAQVRQDVSVVFPVPGLYYVRASVASSDPAIDPSGWVQNAAAPKVVWVNVTPSGGQVISSLEALHTFQHTHATRDPLLVYAAQPAAAMGLSAQPATVPICDPSTDPTCDQPPPDPSPSTFTGTLVYYNQRVGYNMPLPRAKVAIFDSRGGGFNSVTQTDANGQFTLDCPGPSSSGYLQMAASSTNADVTVLVTNRPSMPQVDLGYWPDRANATVNECGMDTGVYAVGAPSQAEFFDNTTQTVFQSRQIFQVSRGPIGINFVDGPQDSTLASYVPTTDSITVHEGLSTGSYGLFVAAHEYGHAVHNARLGGIILSSANAAQYSCKHHNYRLVTNYQCAYVEGIADYHAVATWGVALGDTINPDFNNGVFAGDSVGQSNPPTGPSTEGTIASTLLHLGDGTGSRYVYDNAGRYYIPYSDNVALTHAKIAATIRDCYIELAGPSPNLSVPADGVDYLMYCMDQSATYYSACLYSVVGSPALVSAATVGAATKPSKSTQPPTASPNNGCTPAPGTYLPDIRPEERAPFAGLRPSGTPDAYRWSTGGTSGGYGNTPQREGYDLNVRNVWSCNLFITCS